MIWLATGLETLPGKGVRLMPHIKAKDGAVIAYEDHGRGPPLLLLHGWAAHAGFFASQCRDLADDFRVIAPDLRGHRHSPAPSGSLTLQCLADDIRQLAAELALEGVVAVGWSLGAMALWRAALDGMAPALAGMVIIDMTPCILNSQGWSLGLKLQRTERSPSSAAEAIAAMQTGWPTLAPRIARRIFAVEPFEDNARLHLWVAGEIAAQNPVAMADLWQSLLHQDFRADLPALAGIPSLIMHGDRSQLYGQETAQALAGLLDCGPPLRFDRSGHAPHLEEPQAFNAALRQFASTLASNPNPVRSPQKQPALNIQ
jgi:pimeloyl-[acyl-carrier protein] methyl ester esterase